MKHPVLASTLFVLTLLSPLAAAAQSVITGAVTDAASGDPLPGVNVVVQGTTTGTATGAEGRYALDVSPAADTLVFSYIGFQPRRVGIAGRSVIDVALEENVSQLSQMVVVGYGQQDKETLTSAISSVSTEDIADLPGTSANSLIQGRAAGVQVSNDSGEPGGGLFIRVRGSTSISGGSDPLYVVDGVPVESANLSAFGLGGATTNPIAGLNPNNIASIEILKDASATAIYGARAANGVVLITTKRGTDAAPTISFNTYVGMQTPPGAPGLVDGPTFERLQNEAYLNNGGDPSEMPYPNPEAALNTPWSDYVFRDASIQNYDLSVSGGTSSVQYFVSGNYAAQEGILESTAFSRASGRVNLDFDATDDLRFGTSIEYSNTNRDRAENNDNITGVLGGVYFFPANVPVYDADGEYYKFSIFENPLANVRESDITMTDEHLLGNAYAEYTFRPGLSFKTSWSLDNHYVDDESYYSTLLNSGAATNGSGTLINSNYSRWVSENLLSYKTSLGSHMIDALLGGSLEELSFEQTEASGEQFPSNDFRRITSAAVQTSSSDGFKRGLASVFGRVQYNYANKYLSTLTVRRDGSSRFGKENQWGTFPSIALGWVISEEPFMDGFERISNLKLRASYGITGNQSSIDNFQARGLWTGGANYVDLPGTEPEQLANPELKWESTAQLDLGLDLSLFDNRLTLTYDYYDKQTDNLLLAVPVPRTTGFSTVVQNLGAVSNRGMELGLAATPFQREAFSWNVDFNIAGNRNEIEKLASPFNVYNRDLFRYEEGIPMYSFWLHKQLGVDPQTGAAIWASADGSPTTDPQKAARQIVGDPQPTFFGGLTNSFDVGAVDFMFFLQYSYGNDQFHYARFFQEHGGTRNSQFMSSQLDRWQEPGDETMIPALTSTNYAANLRPSRFLEDGSYLRLKNIVLGYTLPQSLLGGLGVARLRVYVSGQNLLTFTNYTGMDPEVNALSTTALAQGVDFYTVPHPRTYTGGLSLAF